MKHYFKKTRESPIYEEIFSQKFTYWVYYITFFCKYVVRFPVQEMSLFNSQ